jgi:predicted O-methyltransferase YrrM
MRDFELDSSALYLQHILSELSPWEERCRKAAEGLELARISLSRPEAHTLRWIVQKSKAKNAVEIGTLTGLSGLYILDGLEEKGHLWTFEKEEKHAQLASPILKEFGQAKNKSVELIIGDARVELPKINNKAPFDFIFIDGNKAAYLDYLNWAESVTRSGSYLVADNVLLGGSLLNDEVKSENINFSKKQREVMREFNLRLLNSKIWKSVLLPTKEGLLIAERI